MTARALLPSKADKQIMNRHGAKIDSKINLRVIRLAKPQN
jgi:hypothetical protein